MQTIDFIARRGRQLRLLSSVVVLTAVVAACNLPMPQMPGHGSSSSSNGHGETGSSAPAQPSAISGASPDVVVTQLTSTSDADESTPTVNADGSVLLFVHREKTAPPATPPPTKKAAKAAEVKQDLDKPVVMALDPRKASAPSTQSADGARANDPAFLPEGSGYIYVSDVMGSWAVVRADSMAAGAAPTLITPASVKEPRHPTVSPDGSLVAFGMKKGEGTIIATTRMDGSHLTALGPGWSPMFSPDGARIAFVRPVNGHAHVHTMEAATGRGIVALTNGDHDDASPSFSPDGTKLAFVSTRGSTSDKRIANVFVVKVDGTELKQLTQSKGDVRDLVWGKDGNIYFAADPESAGQLDLFRLSIAGEKPAPSQGAVSSVWNAVTSPFSSKPAPPPNNSAPASQPAPASTCANACSAGTDACPNLPCVCNDRRIINTKQCDNACCASPEVACAASCRKHNGYSGSLANRSAEASSTPAPAAAPADASPPADTKAPAAVGKSCKKDNECSSGLCVFKGKAQYGYCTKECQSFSECPTFWNCSNVGNGSGKYCVQRN